LYRKMIGVILINNDGGGDGDDQYHWLNYLYLYHMIGGSGSRSFLDILNLMVI
jgi:hypothetical protein